MSIPGVKHVSISGWMISLGNIRTNESIVAFTEEEAIEKAKKRLEENGVTATNINVFEWDRFLHHVEYDGDDEYTKNMVETFNKRLPGGVK